MDINLYTPHEKLTRKSFLSMDEQTVEDIFELLKKTRMLKRQIKAGEMIDTLQGKVLAVVNDLPSVRTKAALSLAVKKCGGSIVYLATREERKKSCETVTDILLSLDNFAFDGFFVRTDEKMNFPALTQKMKKPLICGLTQLTNPCQALSDLFTVWEKKGKLADLKLAWVGRCSALTNSVIIGAVKCGMNVAVACPSDAAPDTEVFNTAMQYGDVWMTEDVAAAVKNADVIYTDGFFDLEESERLRRAKEMDSFKVTEEVMALAKEDAIFMHNLPVYAGLEVSEGVLSSPRSVINEQTENRVYALQAILSLLLK